MSTNGDGGTGPRPLTMGEVLGVIGDQEVELRMLRRYAAELEARLAEHEAATNDNVADRVED